MALTKVLALSQALLLCFICYARRVDSLLSEQLPLSVHSRQRVAANDTSFKISYVEVHPCAPMNLSGEVYLQSSDIIGVHHNLSDCKGNEYVPSNVLGFRVSSELQSSDSISKPLVFVARQGDNNGVVSWSFPLQVEYLTQTFSYTHLTMCPIDNSSVADGEPFFYIDVFTSSKENLSYSISVELLNFEIELDSVFNTTVAPVEPQIYYFKFPDDVEAVAVNVSNYELPGGCTIVSVQNKTCPVNDLYKNAKSKGIFQTMNSSAFITVKADDVNDREFLLVLVSSKYEECYDDSSNTTTLSSESRTLFVQVQSVKPTKDYVLAMMAPLIVCFIIYILSIVICCCYQPHCVPCWTQRGDCRFKAVPFKLIWCENELTEEEPTNDGHSCGLSLCVLNCCANGAVPLEQVGVQNEAEGEREKLLKKNGAEPGPTNAQKRDGYETINQTEQEKWDCCGLPSYVMNCCASQEEGGEQDGEQQDNDSDENERYRVYGWNTITVGIFYALPALQLVFSEQTILNSSGNQDLCYYNFKCAHPAGPISAFNNVWSNVGYVFLGLLFCIIVGIRHLQYKLRISDPVKKKFLNEHGVPQFFGIYYAMGIGLITEGFMSSFYHICPSDANFQFDTAFMFITAGIVLVKVYQNRHPEVHANAFVAFFSFAVIILYTVIGIYNDHKSPIAVRLCFFLLVVIIVGFFVLSFYKWPLKAEWTKYHEAIDRQEGKIRAKFEAFFEFIRQLWISISHCLRMCMGCSNLKKHKCRIIRHLFILVCNILLAIVLVVKHNDFGIATAILTFFVINIVIYILMYTVLKFCHGESLTLLALFLPFLIVLCWGAAYHFFGTVTEWSYTPAKSRDMNHECILLGFYDAHDVWHFLSACGMFTAFLFVLVIDDGVAKVKRETLLKRAV